MTSILKTLLEPTTTGVRLVHDAVEEVQRVETKSIKARAAFVDQGYSERATPYKIRLRTETQWRRVYATPIGNVSVQYIKSDGKTVSCELALDEALHRAEDD